MKDFFRRMFSSGNEVSSKRFNTFYALTSIIMLAFIATFRSEDGRTPEFMYDALALIAGSGMGLTVVEKIFSKPKEGSAVEDSSLATSKPIQKSTEQVTKCGCGSDFMSCDKCQK